MDLTRRAILRGGLAVSAGLLVSYGLAAPLAARAAGAVEGVVWRDPGCGCCGAWVDHMQAFGFRLDSRMTDDLLGKKETLGVPPGLQSCHTAEIAGYLIEGHVPAADVLRLLAEKPEGAIGLSVPGMPAGSPGMEMGGRIDPYQVILWNKDGSAREFARYGIPV